MKSIHLKGSLLVCLIAGTFTLGAAAAAGAQRITAIIRPDISIQVNGEEQAMFDKNNERVYPIEYNGSTYLPIRSIGGMLSQEVVWDSKTQTIFLNTKVETNPEDLTNTALTRRVTQLENSYTTLLSDTEDTAAAGTYSENLTIYYRLNGRCTNLENTLKTLQIDIKEAGRADKLTTEEQASLIQRLTALEGKLQKLQALLLKKYGIEAQTVTAKALLAELSDVKAQIPAVEKLVAAAERAANASEWKERSQLAQTGYKSFRDDVNALQLALNESLRQSVITYAEYNEMAVQADALDGACKAFKERLDKTAAKWSDAKPDEGLGDKDAEAYAQKITALSDEAEALLTKCREYFTNKSRDGEKGLALMKQLVVLEDKLDALEDAIEDSDKFGPQTSWRLTRSLDKVERNLDKAEDFLEKAGIDDDMDDFFEQEADRD